MIEFLLGSLVTIMSVILGSALTIALMSNSKKEVAKRNVKGKTLSS
jgi:hypothetical protein